MSADPQASAIKRASWIAGFVAASALNLLSVSGIADAIVDWRCFLNFDVVVATYQQLRTVVFSWLPFGIPAGVQHYLLLTGSFGVMLNGYSLVTSGAPYSVSTALQTRKSSLLFQAAFYIVPWVFLAWTAYVLHIQRTGLDGYIGIDENEEIAARLQDHRKSVASNRRTFFVIVLMYPIACLGFLFLFSDLAYKVFQAEEIGGVAFREECASR